MLAALRWLDQNGGLEIPHMSMIGRAREWPTRPQLVGLQKRELISYNPDSSPGYWSLTVNDKGRKLLEASKET
jgi:hypothetical protein